MAIERWLRSGDRLGMGSKQGN
jgi:hypothetical protein